MSYEFPEILPLHEFEFETPKGKDGFVLGRAVGVRLGQSTSGSHQVELAIAIEPGQRALRVGDDTASDVGGEVGVSCRSLAGGAAAITVGDLRKFGYDPQLALSRYAAGDADYAQVAAAIRESAAQATPAWTPAQVQHKLADAAGMLALSRGDVEACGLNREVCRLVVFRDNSEWAMKQEAKGTERRIRVAYVNVVPKATVGNAALLKLLGSIGDTSAPPPRRSQAAPSGGGTQSPGGQQSAAPMRDVPADDVSF